MEQLSSKNLSPLTGGYLLVIIGEPHTNDHKEIIIQKISKGLISWNSDESHIDLLNELEQYTNLNPNGECSRNGERIIQHATKNVITEILIHPTVSTLQQCIRNLLSSFTRHRHIIHAGYTFASNGSWILQDGTYSYIDFLEAIQENDVQRVLKAYSNVVTIDLHCSTDCGEWHKLLKDNATKLCKLRINPADVLNSDDLRLQKFLKTLSPFLIPCQIEDMLQSSEIVGNIRFSHPTLYIFPGGQGDAALFGINGFNMLIDGGFPRTSCFWDFTRHLDRLDAVLMTRINNNNIGGIGAFLKRKQSEHVYPQIGHFFCNLQNKKPILSPDGDKDIDPLIVSLFNEGIELIANLKRFKLEPEPCYRNMEPINLYHKVGHGTLNMYVLNPQKDSKEVREFVQKWSTNDPSLFSTTIKKNSNGVIEYPIQNLISVSVLLVWLPANNEQNITRILFPGSTPQYKIFEGIEKLKNLDYLKHSTYSMKKYTGVGIDVGLKKSKVEPIITNGKHKIKREVPKSPIKSNVISSDDHINGGIIEKKVVKISSSNRIRSESLTRKSEPDKKSRHQVLLTSSEDKSVSPKKTMNGHSVGVTTPKSTIKSKVKISASPTPPKSTKEATNRKVVESRYLSSVTTRKEVTTVSSVTTTTRKPISGMIHKRVPSTMMVSRTKKDVSQPKIKPDKDVITDSSDVSTPTGDQKLEIHKINHDLDELSEDIDKEIEVLFEKDHNEPKEAEIQETEEMEIMKQKLNKEAAEELEEDYLICSVDKEKLDIKMITAVDKPEIDDTKNIIEKLKTEEKLTQMTPVEVLKFDHTKYMKDAVKTPDEVADLPIHEEADIDAYIETFKKDGSLSSTTSSSGDEQKLKSDHLESEKDKKVEVMSAIKIVDVKENLNTIEEKDDEMVKEDVESLLSKVPPPNLIKLNSQEIRVRETHISSVGSPIVEETADQIGDDKKIPEDIQAITEFVQKDINLEKIVPAGFNADVDQGDEIECPSTEANDYVKSSVKAMVKAEEPISESLTGIEVEKTKIADEEKQEFSIKHQLEKALGEGKLSLLNSFIFGKTEDTAKLVEKHEIEPNGKTSPTPIKQAIEDLNIDKVVEEEITPEILSEEVADTDKKDQSQKIDLATTIFEKSIHEISEMTDNKVIEKIEEIDRSLDELESLPSRISPEEKDTGETIMSQDEEEVIQREDKIVTPHVTPEESFDNNVMEKGGRKLSIVLLEKDHGLLKDTLLKHTEVSSREEIDTDLLKDSLRKLSITSPEKRKESFTLTEVLNLKPSLSDLSIDEQNIEDLRDKERKPSLILIDTRKDSLSVIDDISLEQTLDDKSSVVSLEKRKESLTLTIEHQDTVEDSLDERDRKVSLILLDEKKDSTISHEDSENIKEFEKLGDIVSPDSLEISPKTDHEKVMELEESKELCTILDSTVEKIKGMSIYLIEKESPKKSLTFSPKKTITKFDCDKILIEETPPKSAELSPEKSPRLSPEKVLTKLEDQSSTISSEKSRPKSAELSQKGSPEKSPRLSPEKILTKLDDQFTTISSEKTPPKSAELSQKESPEKSPKLSPEKILTKLEDQFTTISSEKTPPKSAELSQKGSPEKSPKLSPEKILTKLDDQFTAISSEKTPPKSAELSQKGSPEKTPPKSAELSQKGTPEKSPKLSPEKILTKLEDQSTTISPEKTPPKSAELSQKESPEKSPRLSLEKVLTMLEDQFTTISSEKTPPKSAELSQKESPEKSPRLSPEKVLTKLDDQFTTISSEKTPPKSAELSQKESPEKSPKLSPEKILTKLEDQSTTISSEKTPPKSAELSQKGSPEKTPPKSAELSQKESPEKSPKLSPEKILTKLEDQSTTISSEKTPPKSADLSQKESPEKTPPKSAELSQKGSPEKSPRLSPEKVFTMLEDQSTTISSEKTTPKSAELSQKESPEKSPRLSPEKVLTKLDDQSTTISSEKTPPKSADMSQKESPEKTPPKSAELSQKGSPEKSPKLSPEKILTKLEDQSTTISSEKTPPKSAELSQKGSPEKTPPKSAELSQKESPEKSPKLSPEKILTKLEDQSTTISSEKTPPKSAELSQKGSPEKTPPKSAELSQKESPEKSPKLSPEKILTKLEDQSTTISSEKTPPKSAELSQKGSPEKTPPKSAELSQKGSPEKTPPKSAELSQKESPEKSPKLSPEKILTKLEDQSTTISSEKTPPKSADMSQKESPEKTPPKSAELSQKGSPEKSPKLSPEKILMKLEDQSTTISSEKTPPKSAELSQKESPEKSPKLSPEKILTKLEDQSTTISSEKTPPKSADMSQKESPEKTPPKSAELSQKGSPEKSPKLSPEKILTKLEDQSTTISSEKTPPKSAELSQKESPEKSPKLSPEKILTKLEDQSTTISSEKTPPKSAELSQKESPEKSPKLSPEKILTKLEDQSTTISSEKTPPKSAELSQKGSPEKSPRLSPEKVLTMLEDQFTTISPEKTPPKSAELSQKESPEKTPPKSAELSQKESPEKSPKLSPEKILTKLEDQSTTISSEKTPPKSAELSQKGSPEKTPPKSAELSQKESPEKSPKLSHEKILMKLEDQSTTISSEKTPPKSAELSQKESPEKSPKLSHEKILMKLEDQSTTISSEKTPPKSAELSQKESPEKTPPKSAELSQKESPEKSPRLSPEKVFTMLEDQSTTISPEKTPPKSAELSQKESPEKSPKLSHEKILTKLEDQSTTISSEKTPPKSAELSQKGSPEKTPPKSAELSQKGSPEKSPRLSPEKVLTKLDDQFTTISSEKTPPKSADLSLRESPEKSPRLSPEKVLTKLDDQFTTISSEKTPPKSPDLSLRESPEKSPKLSPEKILTKLEDQSTTISSEKTPPKSAELSQKESPEKSPKLSPEKSLTKLDDQFTTISSEKTPPKSAELSQKGSPEKTPPKSAELSQKGSPEKSPRLSPEKVFTMLEDQSITISPEKTPSKSAELSQKGSPEKSAKLSPEKILTKLEDQSTIISPEKTPPKSTELYLKASPEKSHTLTTDKDIVPEKSVTEFSPEKTSPKSEKVSPEKSPEKVLVASSITSTICETETDLTSIEVETRTKSDEMHSEKSQIDIEKATIIDEKRLSVSEPISPKKSPESKLSTTITHTESEETAIAHGKRFSTDLNTLKHVEIKLLSAEAKKLYSETQSLNLEDNQNIEIVEKRKPSLMSDDEIRKESVISLTEFCLNNEQEKRDSRTSEVESKIEIGLDEAEKESKIVAETMIIDQTKSEQEMKNENGVQTTQTITKIESHIDRIVENGLVKKIESDIKVETIILDKDKVSKITQEDVSKQKMQKELDLNLNSGQIKETVSDIRIKEDVEASMSKKTSIETVEVSNFEEKVSYEQQEITTTSRKVDESIESVKASNLDKISIVSSDISKIEEDIDGMHMQFIKSGCRKEITEEISNVTKTIQSSTIQKTTSSTHASPIRMLTSNLRKDSDVSINKIIFDDDIYAEVVIEETDEAVTIDVINSEKNELSSTVIAENIDVVKFKKEPLDDSDKETSTNALEPHLQTGGLNDSCSYQYEITTAKFNVGALQREDNATSTIDVIYSTSDPAEILEDKSNDPETVWGKPLGLPISTPTKSPKRVVLKTKTPTERTIKKIEPIYVDLTYVPHHGNHDYAYVEFFKKIRARYYVFSGLEPTKEIFNALLEAKISWEQDDLEVTIIPTYDTDTLGYWVTENEENLIKYKIDLSPSASRCTINLQDHDTSCSAYRLEF